LENKEDFDEIIFNMFSSHHESELILYIFSSIFEEDIEYDDNFLELGTQLILFLYGVVDIYTKSEIA